MSAAYWVGVVAFGLAYGFSRLGDGNPVLLVVAIGVGSVAFLIGMKDQGAL